MSSNQQTFRVSAIASHCYCRASILNNLFGTPETFFSLTVTGANSVSPLPGKPLQRMRPLLEEQQTRPLLNLDEDVSDQLLLYLYIES